MDERARAMLSDYLYELETGDRRRGKSYGQDRSISPVAAPAPAQVPTAFDIAAEYAADQWEHQQLKIWKESGRITADGFLRVGRDALKPYTPEDLMRIMPHLNVFDRLAALINLDGVVKEGYMDAHENIREVVQTISRDEFEKVLATPAAQSRIADIVHEQVGVIFGVLLDKLKTPVASALSKKGGRQNKCSKCHQPGHRATTCKNDAPPADEGAAEPDA